MGLLLLVCRLVVRNLLRRRVETALVLVVVIAATAMLSVSLSLGSALDNRPSHVRVPAPQIDQYLVAQEQHIVQTAGWILALLAVASIAVLVGGRMADQTRRVGVLKAIGATPSVVVTVLLTEYLFLIMTGSVAGLVVGSAVAPHLLGPLTVTSAGRPTLSVTTALVVVGGAVLICVAAVVLPSVRVARTSTVHALRDSARSPRRVGWVLRISAHTSAPMLLGLRLAARRPQRSVLSALSVGVTVAALIAAVFARFALIRQYGTLADNRAAQLDGVLSVVIVVLVLLAAVNAVFITWSTALDSARVLALARALGATPRQVSVSLWAAQLLTAIPGAFLGVPAGIALFHVRAASALGTPPLWFLATTVLGMLLAFGALTIIPGQIGARRPIAAILRDESE